jgi:N-methylhydantoinase A
VRYRIGVDVGGTFTDLVLLEEESGRVATAKVPSTPRDPALAFVEGIRRLLAAESVTREAVAAVFHGTTVATNALLQRRLGRTGLLTTEGFRDVIEIRRHVRGPGRIYDLSFRPPEPLVPRPWRLEVRERLAADGSVVTPLDEDHALSGIRALLAEGVESIAVVLLHAWKSGEHEARLRALIEKEAPGCWVSLSSEISPELREYERASTTVVNAALQPVVASYVASLEARLAADQLRAPLRIMQSNGGLLPADRAAARPVHLVVSGPAAGVVGGREIGRHAGFERVITMDMGGTSCDLGLVEGEPRLTPMKEVDGNSIRVPSFDLHVIGAGGGSVAWIDEGGALRVGPQSAGADPGPACYGRGGAEPTVTDANLVLGRLNPAYFLGGAMTVDVAAARAAIETRIARPFGLTVEAAAEGILRVVNAVMAENVKVVSVRQGHDPRDFALVAFGGAGPTHATALMDDLQVAAVLVPPTPGTLSAAGLLATDVRHDHVRTHLVALGAAVPGDVERAFQDLEAQARSDLAQEGIAAPQIALTRWAEMRYRGQGYEVLVPAGGPGDLGSAAGLAALAARFHEAHERLYAHRLDGAAVELVALRLTALGRLVRPAVPTTPAGEPTPPPEAHKGRRRVYFGEAGGWVDCSIYERAALRAGNRLAGPAVVEQMDTTTVLLPGQAALVHPTGTLVVRKALRP